VPHQPIGYGHGPALFDKLPACALRTLEREIPNCRAILDSVTPALKPARTAFSLPGVNETAASLVVATYGTEGDARPLAALCRGLMDAGHEALLLADEATLGSAQALGVPTTRLAGDIRGALKTDHAGVGAKKRLAVAVLPRLLSFVSPPGNRDRVIRETSQTLRVNRGLRCLAARVPARRVPSCRLNNRR
jgi:hypothetical protein